MTRADTLQLKDLNYAVEDICTKLSRKYAKGWPAHVALSPDDGRALVRLGEITKKIPRGVNRGVNTSQLRSNLMNALVEQDVLSVVYDKDAAQDLTESQAQDEFDRGEANVTAMDQATFVLRGSIEVEKLEGEGDEEGIEQYTYSLSLQMWDSVKRRLIVATNTLVQKDRIE